MSDLAMRVHTLTLSLEVAEGERDAEKVRADQLADRVRELEDALAWETTCTSCARMLNASVTADAHRDRYRLAWMSARLGRAAERERAESLFYDREKAKRTTATVRGELFTARATVRRADERLAEVLAERDALRAKLEKARARTARLEEDAAVLAALRAVGVDNWDGYSDAMAALYEAEGS